MGTTASRIAKSAAAMVFISMISKFLGLIRESVTAAFFGADYHTDAYRVAFEIPSILTGVIYAAITITFIPVYSEFKDKTDGERNYFVNNLFTTVTLATAVIAVLGITLAPLLVGIVAPGFNGQTHGLAAKLTAFLFPSIIFLALAYLANGYLQANRIFAAPASMGIPLNLIIILSVILFWGFGIKALAIGSFIAMVSQFVIQVPFIFKAGFRLKPVIDLKEPGLRRVLFLSAPVFISTAFSEASILIDKMLASGLDAGSISVLDYANKVNGIASGIFFASVAIVFFPELSNAADNLYRFSDTITTGLKIVLLISFPIMTGIYILKVPIIKLLFERGEFASSDTYITSVILGLYAIGIIGSGLTAILNRAFYSLKNTRTPMVFGIIAICANILFSIIGVKYWGIKGLAFSSAMASLLCGFSLLLKLRSRIWISLREVVKLAAKSIVASIIMGSLVYLINLVPIYPFSHDASFLALFLKLSLSIGIGAFAYVGVLYLLKTEELIYVTRLIKKKVKPNGN